MFSKAQFVQVCAMQNALNNKAAGPDWQTRNLPWDVAVIREVGECFDHLSWEWWKQSQPNLPQAQLELIDIIHFAVSGTIATRVDQPYEFIYDEIEGALSAIPAEDLVMISQWGADAFLREAVANAVTQNFAFVLVLAIKACERLGMTTDQVFSAYVGKNVLNGFRKANGYKEGTYIKMWHGREDNEHLSDVLAVADPSKEDFIERLNEHLTTVYQSVKEEQPTH